jgi:hypothetical protein
MRTFAALLLTAWFACHALANEVKHPLIATTISTQTGKTIRLTLEAALTEAAREQGHAAG